MTSDSNLTAQQQVQEEEYSFPYHYLHLVNEWHDMRYQSLVRTVVKLIEPFEGQRVLDAGCGDGRLCYELKDKKVDVSGVDYSSQAIGFARAFCPGITFHACPLEELSIEDKYDVIVLTEVLEHIVPENIPGVLQNIADRLTDGGRFIITVPSVNAKLAPKHYQHFTPESLAETLATHFEVESTKGHLKSGMPKWLYKVLEVKGELLAPLAKKIKCLRFYYGIQRWYLKTFFEQAAPEKACRLIAVCKKK